MLDVAQIVGIMGRLKEDNFRFSGEANFRDKLGAEIQKLHIDSRVQVEHPFAIDRMPNHSGCFLDLTATNKSEVFCIELKYAHKVTNEPGQIPYDSRWDCAKIEALIQAGHIQDGIVVALTDKSVFWDHKERRNWARNFYLPDHGDWHALPHLNIVESAPCKHATMFSRRRFHILLRDVWEYCWFDYGLGFRFAILRRKGKQPDINGYQRHAEWRSIPENRLNTIPFATAADRDTAMEFSARYHALYRDLNPPPATPGWICPICRDLLSIPETASQSSEIHPDQFANDRFCHAD